MTARESALACYDVLAAIFDHLTPAPCDGEETTERSRRSCRKALISSARVCTTLSHHALNALWRELDTIHPLLKTLPNCRSVAWQLTLCGAISDEDWARLQFYANRVRVIAGTMEPELLDLIHPSVWLYLSARCKGSPLMPRLHTVVALNVHTSETPALILLMAPSLRSLHIFFALEDEANDRTNAPHVATALLQTIPLMAPDLESFYCDVDISLGHGYLKAFRQFTRLNTLSVSSKLAIDESALRTLPDIANLRDLSCAIATLRSSPLALGPYTFPTLTTLTVSGRCDDLTAFIGACQLPRLTRIGVSFKEPPRSGDLADSIAAVCKQCNPALLTSVRVTVVYAPGSGRLMQYLEPFLPFHNIKTFDLWSSSVIPSIHDDDLAKFGAAWPRVTNFRISHLVSRQDIASSGVVPPTLSGLVDLARRCPHLESFRAPALDAKVFPDKNATPPMPVGHRLRSLSITDMVTLPAPKSRAFSEVARILDGVFPSIVLEDARARAVKNMKGWDKLKGLLATMRLRRETKS